MQIVFIIRHMSQIHIFVWREHSDTFYFKSPTVLTSGKDMTEAQPRRALKSYFIMAIIFIFFLLLSSFLCNDVYSQLFFLLSLFACLFWIKNDNLYIFHFHLRVVGPAFLFSYYDYYLLDTIIILWCKKLKIGTQKLTTLSC